MGAHELMLAGTTRSEFKRLKELAPDGGAVVSEHHPTTLASHTGRLRPVSPA